MKMRNIYLTFKVFENPSKILFISREYFSANNNIIFDLKLIIIYFTETEIEI